MQPSRPVRTSRPGSFVPSTLAQPRDLDSLLTELDRYREEIRRGRLCIDKALQREPEFIRFKTEYTTFFGGFKPFGELYQLFTGLGELPTTQGTDFPLTEQHMLEAKRAAYEAVGLLEFQGGFAPKPPDLLW